MGDGRAGLLDGGDGPAGRGQVAQVEGHGLRGSGQCGVATGLGPLTELPPGGGVGPAGVPGLGVPESGGTASAAPRSRSGRSRGVIELLDDARAVVMDAPVKLVIILYYHGFNSPL